MWDEAAPLNSQKSKHMANYTKINTTVKAIPGDHVNVGNYRMKGTPWESGEVLDVEIGVKKDGSTRNTYRVVLHRRSLRGDYLFLHVGDNLINRTNQVTK